MLRRLVEYLFPIEGSAHLIRPEGVHHCERMGGRLNAFRVEFLHPGCVLQDQPELGLIVGELFVAQPESGEPRNMSNVDIDGHPLSVGAVAGQIVGASRPG